MSAFVCNPEHLGLLAAAAVRWGITAKDPQYVAGILAKQNLASMISRYPRDQDGDRSGPLLYDRHLVEAATLYAAHYMQHWPSRITARDIANMCDCYNYQSCENPGWDETEAVAIVRALKKSVSLTITPRTPQTVEWEFTDSTTRIRRVAAAYRYWRMKFASKKQAA